MKSTILFSVLCLCLVGLMPQGLARPGKSLAIVPDPSCRSNKLDVEVEKTLGDNLRAPGLKLTHVDPSKASLVLQYILRVQTSDQGVIVQLDGEIVGNRNNKLYAEGSVRSDAFSDDENGRIQAARQAGRRLGQALSDGLADSLAMHGSGRRVLLQVTLASPATEMRQQLIQHLKKAFSSMSLRIRPSTEKNLVMTLMTSESTKELAALVEKSLSSFKDMEIVWQVKTKPAMMLKINKK